MGEHGKFGSDASTLSTVGQFQVLRVRRRWGRLSNFSNDEYDESKALSMCKPTPTKGKSDEEIGVRGRACEMRTAR